MEVNGRIDQVRRCHRRFLKRAGGCIDLLGRYFVWIWKKDQVKLVDRYLWLNINVIIRMRIFDTGISYF